MQVVESCEKTLNSRTEHDAFELGRLEENLAFALYNAAMRSSEGSQFRQRIGRASASYERAAKSYGDANRDGFRWTVVELRCDDCIPAVMVGG